MKIISNFSHHFRSKKSNAFNFNFRHLHFDQHQSSNHHLYSNYFAFEFRFYQSRALRVVDIMMFDSIKHAIDFFIRRFQQISKIENVWAILRVLLMCFEKNVLKWHNDFFFNIQMKMNADLTMWKNELLKKYRRNRFVSIRKIQQMLFRFDRNLIFNQYFSRKINLLRDAEMTNETLLIHYLWEKLNAQLTFVISIRKNNDIVDNFNKKTKINEIVVKKIHDLNKKFNITIRFYQKNIQNQNQSRQRSNQFFFTTNRIQRLIDNYQKTSTTTSAINRTQFTSNNVKKVSLLSNVNNKISTTKIKFKNFRLCRHCDDDHYDHLCFTKIFKIMTIEIKKKMKTTIS